MYHLEIITVVITLWLTPKGLLCDNELFRHDKWPCDARLTVLWFKIVQYELQGEWYGTAKIGLINFFFLSKKKLRLAIYSDREKNIQ